MENRLIYRPEWTCGRFNPESKTAIMYNLITGVSSFFESYSALVIGEILSIPKNGNRSIQSISDTTGISIESISEFIDILKANGLVTDRIYLREEITELRKEQGQFIKIHPVERDLEQSAGKIDMANAEQMFTDSLDLNRCIPSVMFELTYNCSERCIHCYNSGATRNDCEVSHRNREEMTLDDYKRVIDELYDMGLYKICLTGGDPFSKPHIWEIIDYIYNKDIALDIFTNGQSIVKNADRLAWYYPRLVGLSIYSAIPEIHDRITRVKGSFEKTLSVASQLSDLGVTMAFKCAVFRTNIKSYRTVKSLAEEYGAIPQFEINITNGVDGDVSIVENLGLPDNVMEILFRDPLTPMYVSDDSSQNRQMIKPLDAYPCKAGFETYSITPEGNVQPCCAFPLSFGNVGETSVSDILQSEGLNKLRHITIQEINECGRHEKCNYCFLCPGNAFIECGSPLMPSLHNCHMAELRYRVARKITEGQDPLQGKSVEERLNDIDIPDIGTFSRKMARSYRNRNL